MSYPVYKLTDRLKFGSYTGRLIKSIIDVDVKHIKWLLENIPTFKMDKEATEFYQKILKRDNIQP